MKLIKVDDNGNVTVFDDVLDFGCWTKDDIQQRVADFDGGEFTADELETFSRRCDKLDSFPDGEIVDWTIKDILEERNERT